MKKINRLSVGIFAAFVIVVCYFSVIAYIGHKAGEKYNKAEEYLEHHNYEEALELYKTILFYEDSSSKVNYIEGEIKRESDEASMLAAQEKEQKEQIQKKYSEAIDLYNNGKYTEAVKAFAQVIDYEDSKAYYNKAVVMANEQAKKDVYLSAITEFNTGYYERALENFSVLGDYSDSLDRLVMCKRYVLSKTFSAGIRGSFFFNENRKLVYNGDVADIVLPNDKENNFISVSWMGKILAILSEDGHVYIDGAPLTSTDKEEISQFSNIIQVAVGQQYAVVLSSDGKVHAVGHNGDGQCNVNETWMEYNFKEISCAWRTTAGLTDTGDILIEGYRTKKIKNDINNNKENWSDVVHISIGGGVTDGKGAGNTHLIALTKKRGHHCCWRQ